MGCVEGTRFPKRHHSSLPRALYLRTRPRALLDDFFDLQVPYAPQIEPVLPTAVSESDEATASSHEISSTRRRCEMI
jgi:hypothetical protein